MTRFTALSVKTFAKVMLLATVSLAPLGSALSDDKVAYKIPAQDASSALMAFAEASSLRFMAPSEDLNGISTKPLTGSYTPRDGLKRLLDGTGLAPEFTQDGTVTIKRIAKPGPSSDAGGEVKVAQASIQSGRTASDSSPLVNRPTGVLEEITVTARKREESVLDIPFGLSVLTADDILSKNLKDLVGVQDFTPGFYFSEFGSGRGDRAVRNFVIRGINVNAFANSNDAVLAFVDGAPVVGGEVPSFTEAERIEVLKGPQSAYFGRNTFTGAINIITKTPGDEWAGKTSAEYASPGSTDFYGSVEGPIAAGLLTARLSARQIDKKGDYLNNADGTTLGDRRSRTLSGTAYATPTDNFSVKIFGEYARFDDGPGPDVRLDSAKQSNCNPRGLGSNNWFCGVVTKVDPSTLGSNAWLDDIVRTRIIQPNSIFGQFIKKGGLAKKSNSLHAIAKYEFNGGYEFSSISAYHRSKTQLLADVDARDTQNIKAVFNQFRAFNNFLSFIERDFEDLSQELRLTSPQDSKLRWTAGGNYVHPKVISSSITVELDIPGGVIRLAPSPQFTSDTYGAFGGVYYDFTDQFTASVEARYQVDDVAVASPGLERSFKSFAPRLSLEYKQDNWNFFANWARGFRPGLFNSRLLGIPQSVADQIIRQTGATLTVDEENLNQYELGVKGTFWERRGNVSLVGYTGNITNQQIASNTTVIQSGVPVVIQVITNSGQTDINGIEAETAVVFPIGQTDELLLNGTFAWNDVKFKQYLCITCLSWSNTSDVRGNRFPGAPAYSATLTGRYTHSLESGLSVFGQAEYIYKGNIFATESNLEKSGTANKINLRMGLEADDWSVEGFITNLTRDRTPLGFSPVPDLLNPGRQTLALSLPADRNYGLRVNYKF